MTRNNAAAKPRKRGAAVIFIIIMLAAVIIALKAGGILGGGGDVKVPTGNIKIDFNVDFDELGAKYVQLGGDFNADPADIDALERVAAQNSDYTDEINFFIEHIGSFGQTAVNTLILSPEKAGFVLLEPFADEQGYDSGVSVRKGTVPYFIQYDSRWGYAQYGSGAIGYTACGPTCLAMAAAGITGDESYTPLYMSRFAEENGYYVPGTGTAWSLFTEGAAKLGLTGEEIVMNEYDMYRRLSRGEVIIASMSSGDFTYAGHFIVIYGYTLGAFKIYDPSSIERSSRSWSIEQLSGQTANLWSIGGS